MIRVPISFGECRSYFAINLEEVRRIPEGPCKEGDWLSDVHIQLNLTMRNAFANLREPFAPYQMEK